MPHPDCDHSHHQHYEYCVGNLSAKLTIPCAVVIESGSPPSSDIPDDYTIIPKAFEDQIIATTGKQLDHDILVKAVPYHETSNDSDGLTAYIAEEVMD